MEFSYLNFCCRYIAKISGNPNTLQYINTSGTACFSSIFRRHVEVLTILCYRYPNDKYWNNYCLFNPNEIRKILRYLQTIVCFKSELTITDDEYRITFSNLDKLSFIERKLLYTLSRIFFEYPMNVIGYDALQLKRYPKFKNKSYWELLDLVTKSCPINQPGHWFRTDHLAYNLESLHNVVRKAGNRADLLIHDMLGTKELPNNYTWITKVENSKEITDENSFNRRLEIYNTNYKLIKIVKL